ncbi:DsrE family protein [Thiohalomonas denitrificans]|uniref:DsrE family protein n=1 Tax=Thiohalomonas denitrificans TaxID=415747 RepID=UPI0026EE2C37|nr:DsrE family protein [Thiohalomonas denitrificans]
MKILSTVLIAAALITLAGPAAAERYGEQKVVYHVNDFARANAALRNIGNHLDATGDDRTDIVVVTHSGGINFLLDNAQDKKGNTFEMDVLNLSKRGVEFRVCANTLSARNLDEGDYSMLEEVIEVVPSGVAEVAHLQQQGYVLLKP